MIAKLKGWIARDDYFTSDYQHTYLYLYLNKPIRDGNYGWKDPTGADRIPLNNSASDIEWHHDPIEVEIEVHNK
jgi:hypothetical protein